MKVIAFMESALPINFLLSDFIVSHTIFSPSYVRLFVVVYFCFSLVICFIIFAIYKEGFGLCWKGETVTLLADEKAC